MDITERIKQKISTSPVVLFMKGTPDFPQCGFSMQAARALQACKAKFDHVDVIAEPDYRQHLPKFSNWPTFPQLYINGELVGGCDIILDMYQKGELQKELDSAATAQSS